jgi:hypothetical protein
MMISGGKPMYEEHEALDKWCPLRGNGLLCQGSGCMMWRWQPLMADDAFAAAVKSVVDGGISHKNATAHVIANRRHFGLPETEYKGYCGLAGGFLN